jgi:hypothetical protein
MRLTHEIAGISKIVLILLLSISFIVGALFSYVYTMGLYAPSEFLMPDKPVMSIQSVEFSNQDTHFFDFTVLNPSYSMSDVTMTRVETRTPDENIVHVITSTVPSIPFVLQKGHSQTFRANWNWANYSDIKLPYTDTPIEIRVFLEDGRGEIFEIRRPLTRLTITEHRFDPSRSVNHFNLTVENLASSETHVNITAFIIGGNLVQTDKVTPTLPYMLNPGDAPAQFQCLFNWTGFMGQSVTLGVDTEQGYITRLSPTLPGPVTLDIPTSQIVFNATISTQQFNITVTNDASSSTPVDINRITVTVGQQTPVNITQTTPNMPLRLDTNTSQIIVCAGWDWSAYNGQTVKITAYTTQGFTVSKETQIP